MGDKTRGLFVKYQTSRADGAPSPEAAFILRPKDPHARAAMAADSALMEELAGRYVVRKFLRWEGGGRSVDDPGPWPVWSDPLPDAVALPLGVRPGEPADPGADLVLPPVPDPRVRRVLLAYAESCAGELPVLAADLRRMAAEGEAVA